MVRDVKSPSGAPGRPAAAGEKIEKNLASVSPRRERKSAQD